MTSVKLHGILAREYGDSFTLNIGNPRTVLQAIDCNRDGFIRRVISLQKEGFFYDLVINKQRIIAGEELDGFTCPKTIDIVPVIAGSGPGQAVAAFIFKAVFYAIVFAAIAAALAPKPDEIEALEIEAGANKQSLVFTNRANIASQGAAVPVGYGRLIVGTQVIQATIKSYPQYSDPEQILTDGSLSHDAAFVSNRRAASQFAQDPPPGRDGIY